MVYSPLALQKGVLGNFLQGTTAKDILRSLRAECGDQFVYRPLRVDGNPVMCAVTLEGQDELEQSQEIKLHALGRMLPDKSRRRFRPLLTREIVSEYPRGLRHQASGREFKLESSSGPLLNNWEKNDNKTDRSQCEMALLVTPGLCLGRQRHHHVDCRRRRDTRHTQC